MPKPHEERLWRVYPKDDTTTKAVIEFLRGHKRVIQEKRTDYEKLRQILVFDDVGWELVKALKAGRVTYRYQFIAFYKEYPAVPYRVWKEGDGTQHAEVCGAQFTVQKRGVKEYGFWKDPKKK